MENLAICPLCERQHRVDNGWAFCPSDPKKRDRVGSDPAFEAMQKNCAGLRSVQEREEAFWRYMTLDGFHDFPVFETARLVLPSVMASLLDARADPNLRPQHRPWSVPDLRVYDMETPLHEVLSRLAPKHWYKRGATSGIAAAVPDCVKLLVQFQADLSLVDAWDRTPLQVVLQHRRAGIHFASGLERRVLKFTEQCVEIMGAQAMAAMPSRDAEAATDLRHPWCEYCMRSLSCLERRNLRVGACDACYWKRFAVWCAQCDAWRPLVAESEAVAKLCPKCQVLVQPSRYFCQSCGDPHAACECPKEDSQGLLTEEKAASREEKTTKKRKRLCTECGKHYFSTDWCSTQDWENTTGYCERCGMTCSICNITKVKQAYDNTHWDNVKKQSKKHDRQPRCQACADMEKNRKFQCARCVANGEKQWFGKDHFHPKDLDNCKQRQTWEKLQCRLP